MKLDILGTGTFFANINRTASAFILEIENKKILIDCGPGTLVRLSQIGLSPEDLDYVFITHFHPDHTSDLFPLFMNYRLSDLLVPGSVKKFPKFYGPEGLDKFLSAYSHNSELLAYDAWGKIKVFEYQSLINIDNYVVKPFKVDHSAFGLPARAYALRFESNNKVVVFSGDSTKCDGLQTACQNADIFVCDASSPKNQASPAHMDTYDIGEISQQSQVKKVILTHFYPQYDDVDLVSQVKEKFSGEVIHGQDLTSFEI
ncbi:MBL fold metallo-hydrolase [Patescibacteria group bacterium]|nr:MBL fold metallo-hydrolase [Patescibacteria group bacterium]